MRRCTLRFLVTLALVMFTALRAAEAQQMAKVPRIGYLHPRCEILPGTDAFRQGLCELGYVEGQNIAIEDRCADGQFARLPDLVAELVQLPGDVIMVGGENAARVAQHATRTIPMVIAAGGDPVELGLVASLAQPGGNITGLSLLSLALGGKRLELLKELVPTASQVAVLFNPTDATNRGEWREMEGAARLLGVQLHALEVRSPAEFESAFATATRQGVGALMTLRNWLLEGQRTQIIDFAAKSRLPAMYEQRAYVEAGGLISYGPSLPDTFRRAATYVDKILKGAKPADLPVEQPTKFEFVINLKTAEALGLTIPSTLLFQADEVLR
jgi:putative tryptophan/tyrosine transport system substrate-binding protein